MKDAAADPASIDAYIAGFPEDIQEILEQVRSTIRTAVPDAGEAIQYGMPAFTLNGNLVYFAAFKNHVGFYATPAANEAFKAAISGYKTGKGSIQFPLNEPMPLTLIASMVSFRAEKNRGKSGAKIAKQPL